MGQHGDASTQSDLPLSRSLKWFQSDSVSHVFTTDSIFHRFLRCLSKRVFFLPLSVYTPLGMKPWSCTHAIQTLPFPLTCNLLKLAFSGVNDMAQWIKIVLQRPEKLGLISRSHGGEKAWTPRSHLQLMYSHTYAHSNKTEFLNLVYVICFFLTLLFARWLEIYLVGQTQRW